MKFTLILLIAIFLFGPDAFAEDESSAQPVLRVGMAKEEVYKAYPVDYQEKYRKTDNDEEWILFNDWTAKTEGHHIVFYLRGGKVVWWDRDEMPDDPAERLKVVKARQQHKPPEEMTPVYDGREEEVLRAKEEARKAARGGTGRRPYYKTVH